jgi:hypothetical protein
MQMTDPWFLTHSDGAMVSRMVLVVLVMSGKLEWWECSLGTRHCRYTVDSRYIVDPGTHAAPCPA